MKKIKNKYYIVILIILFISVGFAYLSATLNVTGFTRVMGNNWNIYFNNIQYVRGQSFETIAPTTTGTTTTSVSYQVFLPSPGDVYKFNIDIVNGGSLDAMVKVVTDTDLTAQQKQYASYYVTYSDGISADDYQLLPKNSTDTLSVMVAYNRDIDEANMPSTDQSINITFHIEYEQATSKASSRNHITMVNRQTTGKVSVGDEIALGDEHFYVIETNNEKTTLLAKYNLYVGQIYKVLSGIGNYATGDGLEYLRDISKTEDGYLLQNSDAIGYNNLGKDRIGIVKFSTANYWKDPQTNTLRTIYGDSYDDNNIYDARYSDETGNDYSIAYYVEAYGNLLSQMNYKIIGRRLLILKEANYLRDNGYQDILYNTSYYLGSAVEGNTRIIRINQTRGPYNCYYDQLAYHAGVRPVIEIPALDI